MKHFILLLYIFSILVISCTESPEPKKISDDPRVMLQGFYWESYRHGHTGKFPEIFPGVSNIEKYWYEIVMEKAPVIREGRFDLIWLPPPSDAGGGAGYSPIELFDPGNMYGDSAMHRSLLVSLWNNGIEPVADIVINHRNGKGSWAGFKNPGWGTKSICRSDEAFHDINSEVYSIADSLRGNDEENITYDGSRTHAYAYNAYRDIDHTFTEVQQDIVKYLLFLKSMGYRGWRYDMVHGFHARRIALYNLYSSPTFSVGEYDWDKHEGQRGWIWNTSTDTSGTADERFETASSVFDFSTYFALVRNIGSGCNNNPAYMNLYGFNNGLGMIGDNTDGYAWKNKSVTFAENHDTGWRTNEDGTNQEHHDNESFSNNWQIEQAYAYILTHPGVPCVFWKHYFDWGTDLQNKIRAMINARKVAGVHSGSTIHTQNIAREAGVYAAFTEGKNGRLFVRIGGTDAQWNPAKSDYSDYVEYASGDGWKIWVSLNALSATAGIQQFPFNDPLNDIPEPRRIDRIKIKL